MSRGLKIFHENHHAVSPYSNSIFALSESFFALIYIAAFHATRWNTLWFGAGIGLVHSLFVLSAGMLMLPSVYPRMATEQHGPTPTRLLEPPGFLAQNYGKQTPIASMLAHLIYGGILGYFCRF